MNILQKDKVYRAATEALNNGEYVTLIFYTRGIDGKDYIKGQTFNRCFLQSIHL